MKKMFSAAFLMITLCAVLAFPAFAANLDGDAQSCAEALRELNLFLGTDKGFELERPMTRAEAAVMLVRFFGAEEKALAGSYKHPFTDVPQWADKYVGWLYVSGLANGVAPTLYGSQQSVTAWQYGTFITRALREDEVIPNGLIREDEITAIDANKNFIRADAAIMSVRALGCQYTKNGNYRPLADVCIERKLFTAEEFGNACFSFFSTSYVLSDDGYITLRILGIDIRKTADGGYFTNQSIDPIASDGTRYDPFVYRQNGEMVTIYSMNPLTLETTELACRTGIIGRYNYQNPFKLGETHFIFETLADQDKNTLLAVKGGKVNEVLSFINGGESAWYPYADNNIFIDADSVLIMTYRKYYCVTEDGFSEIGEGNLQTLAYIDGVILAKRINEASIDVVLLDVKAGKEIVSYNVPDDIERGEYGKGYRDLGREREGYYYGEAGLYFYNDATLTQITAKPANDFIKLDDGSHIILTHKLGQRYAGIIAFGGNEIMRISPDGSEERLTPENMDVDAIDSIFLKDSKVHFVTACGVGMMHFDRYTYRIEDNGKLTVTDFNAGRPEVMDGFTWDNPEGYKERYIKAEQARIDALGY